MSFEVFKSVDDKIDEFFHIAGDNTGNWVRVKLPWNKSYRWVKVSVYRRFRCDIANLLKEDDK